MTVGFPQVGIDRETLLLRKSRRIKRKSRPLRSHFAQYFSSGRLASSRPPPPLLGSSCINAHPQLSLSHSAKESSSQRSLAGWNFIASVAGECSLLLFPYLLPWRKRPFLLGRGSANASVCASNDAALPLRFCDLHTRFCIFREFARR